MRKTRQLTTMKPPLRLALGCKKPQYNPSHMNKANRCPNKWAKIILGNMWCFLTQIHFFILEKTLKEMITYSWKLKMTKWRKTIKFICTRSENCYFWKGSLGTLKEKLTCTGEDLFQRIFYRMKLLSTLAMYFSLN